MEILPAELNDRCLDGGDENTNGDEEPVLPGTIDDIQPIVDATIAVTVSQKSARIRRRPTSAS